VRRVDGRRKPGQSVPADRIGDYYPGVSTAAANDALDFANYVDSYDPDSRVA
jgi:hypothetical protein